MCGGLVGGREAMGYFSSSFIASMLYIHIDTCVCASVCVCVCVCVCESPTMRRRVVDSMWPF